MYDDRLEIFSPGALPNIVTLENMRVKRYARNPRISRTLTEFGWVKELNEGVKRIYEEMQEFYLNDPIYSEPDGTSVQLVLEKSITSRRLRTTERVDTYIDNLDIASLSGVEREIISYLYNKNTINSKVAAELLNKSRPYANKLQKKLADESILVWHGSGTNDPTQYYTLNRKNF